ncbi:MAG: hypothetical protein ABI609_00370 [Acidobacteriota bacterium]
MNLPATSWMERLGRVVLGGLLMATLVGALRLDRTQRALVGDEATFAMQAESLAFDFDLRYTRADYDRFVATWQRPPDGLILQTTDGGKTLTYGKPALYALAIAPFVRLSPLRGAQVGNLLFLALAAWLVARALRPVVGAAIPWWVACWIFASVSFAYVTWEHAEVFLLAATASGFALVYGVGEDEDQPARGLPCRFALAGALIAVVGASRIFYLALLAPLWLAIPRPRVGARRAALIGGALLVLTISGLGRIAAGGDWSGYGAERRGFYPRTGYPEVDFPASEWPQVLAKLGNTSWTQEGAISWNRSPRLWAWDSWYFLVGRDIGVLPYFLPLLLGVFAFRRDRGRWAIPLAVLLAMSCFLLVRPHNFFGGVGAIGDRYFLPLYPALWFLAGRAGRVRSAIACAVLAAPFLWTLWRAPTMFPVAASGRYAYVSPAAEALLPYETSLSHLPGGEDVAQNGLWFRFVNDAVGREAERPWLRAGSTGEILIGSPAPLAEVRIDFRPEVPATLEVSGARLVSVPGGPAGEFVVAFDRASARHPMWWTADDYYLYRLRLKVPPTARLAAQVPFRISPAIGDPAPN